jgi:hypothetical protein
MAGDCAMNRVGVIHNPGSERNKGQRWRRHEVARRCTDILHVELAEFDELSQVVAEFAQAGVELIVVDGGDGTVQAVLTAVLRGSAFNVPPKFAVIASGMTNLIAADVGVRGRHRHALRRLIEARASGTLLQTMRRPTLGMELMPSATAPAGRIAYGMFFGAAAFHHVAQFARRRIHSAGIKHRAAVAAALAVAAGRLLSGDVEWRRGERIALTVDGASVEAKNHFLFLATTLHRLVLGLHPFWGDALGPLRFLDIVAPPHRFARALLPAMLGRPRPWMSSNGYRSGRADRLALVLSSPFMLDGEVFAPVSDQAVVLFAGPTVEFVCP